ncbi:DNA repair protein RecO [Paracoccus pacificus]|uniref:DNA repair protein RecO n=1 Tax=Paracoccus pacificus TaxID=1463598 RepID=A0ABW4RAB3_9RHOB
MEWRGEGTVIGRRPHGESALILDLFSVDAGRVSGLLPGGASARKAPITQLGCRLSVQWRARLNDQLGTLSVEPAGARPGLLASAAALDGVSAVSALLVTALAERDPHPRLYALTEDLLDAMDSGGPDWATDYVRWELALLEEMGFGLDLGSCAVNGSRRALAYVSPRTGRAVSREGAGEWAPRLLPLPPMLGGEGEGGLRAALALTGHFLEQRLAEHTARPLPAARGRLVARLLRHPGAEPA